ncbi:FAD-dependent oxidoreductase [Oceanispirochaeta crateris]|uniref:FAD-dependent oxidoreductase n=2 Tax=Oceanispirochaeta crateris TaxID=2518645 RepID=A0A5C1QGP7_9SPIO|nr:FAD-dependent oxidoreductase [Oceanispirochaeta crateris]
MKKSWFSSGLFLRMILMKKSISYYDYIIIGASKAGLTAATVLREIQKDAAILIINGEDRLPYKRTHLTKFLARGFDTDDFALEKRAWFQEQCIDLLDSPAQSIDSKEKSLRCADDKKYFWGTLLLATGAVPKELSIPGHQWLSHLRTARDTESIRAKLLQCKDVLVLGQGVEGVELAEQCSRLGLTVTLIGRDDRLMKRWLDESQSARLLALLEQKGVRCIFGQSPCEIGKEGEGYTMKCDNQQFHGDMILSSTGICGNPVLAEDLGIYAQTGVPTDLYCQTEIPGIYAAGDVVQTPPGWPTGLWHWAEYLGTVAAMNMGGQKQMMENRPTRLKSEPFGSFYYSMSYQEVQSSDKSDVFMDNDRGYVRIFSREGRSISALMTGLGKGISKILDAGVKIGKAPGKIFATIEEAMKDGE